MLTKYFQQGLTLLELLVTIAIISIVVAIGAPSIMQVQKSLQLKGAVQTSYFAFQQARSEAISAGADVTVSLTSGTNWCIGISDSGDCDCNQVNACTINGVEQIVKGSDFNQVSMQDLNFGADSIATFDGVLGFSVGSLGSTVFTDGSNEVKLNLNNMGRASICVQAGSVGNYSAC
ncbi:GspH/FimT family pseudopilin [Paraglaciecola aestuariivivens]